MRASGCSVLSRPGLFDPRGVIILHILRLVRATAPKIVVLENVGGLVKATHREFFEAVLSMLRDTRWSWLPGQRYNVAWRMLDTKDFKIPHSRPRVYIVAIRADSLQNRLVWPRASRAPCHAIDDLLDGPRPSRAFLANALPPPTSGNARLNVINELRKLRERGVDPLEDTHVIEIDNCATSDGFASTVMRGCSPCLTRRRAQTGGHWVSTRGRRLTTAEMLKLQAMRPARLVVPPSVPESAFRAMVGNAMSVSIVEALLASLSRACPAIFSGTPLPDRWSAT